MRGHFDMPESATASTKCSILAVATSTGDGQDFGSPNPCMRHQPTAGVGANQTGTERLLNSRSPPIGDVQIPFRPKCMDRLRFATEGVQG